MKHLMPKGAITRRDALKGMSAVVAAAALTGCSTGDDGYSEDENYVHYKPDLTLEKFDKCAFSTGAYDCGGSCVHKYHIKNDRIVSMTSAGDIERVTLNENDPDNPDEWENEDIEKPTQFRACVKGYAYTARIYQPDRIKYPMMQTKQRGDATGFVRVSWETAGRELGKKLADTYKKAGTLGYVPVIWDGLIGSHLQSDLKLTGLTFFGNPSQGLIEAAKMDCVGQDMFRNSRNDRYNSGFIINMGADPGRQSNWETSAYWTLQKAKEKNIDIVTIAPNCGASATLHSRSFTVRIPVDTNLPETSGQDVRVPGWIAIRPGTDGALLTAMMYIIYRRKLYDYEFLMSEYTGQTVADRKSFGFWKKDTVVSVSPKGTHGGIPAATNVRWNDFATNTYDTPEGLSFEEYLVSLEDEIKTQGWSPISVETAPNSNIWQPANGGWLKPDVASANPACGQLNAIKDNRGTGGQNSEAGICIPDVYYGIIEYASRLTGVNALLIEALACHFAHNGKENKASLLDIGCGPQRAYNGAEYYWLAMCMSAMCGHADKKGGGLGLGVFSVPDQWTLVEQNARTIETAAGINRQAPTPSYDDKTSTVTPATARVVANSQMLGELILNGRDARDADRFRADTRWLTHYNGVDKGLDIEKIELEGLFYSGSNYFFTLSNINKNIAAYNKLKAFVYMGHSMTPTAMMADFVFPETSPYDQNKSDIGAGISNYQDGKMLVQNILRHNIYDVQPTSYSTSSNRYYAAQSLIESGVPNIRDNYTLPALSDTVTASDTVLDDMDDIKTRVEGLQSSATYNRATGVPVTGRSFEKMKTMGVVSLPIPSTTPVIAMKHHRAPGGDKDNGVAALSTTTGYFNFYSPFWGDASIRRDHLITQRPANNFSYPAGWRTAVAKYVPLREGYEQYFEDNNPYNQFKGFKSKIPNVERYYTLQYITNKSVHRIHTVGGNTALLNETFREGVYMNSSDAAARGISDGQQVYVYNDRGCMRVPAIVSNYMAPGVISVEHGAWYKPSTDTSDTYNAIYETNLKADGTTDIVPISTRIDLGGSANLLTDDMFTLDPIYVRNTSSVHGGPCEVSATKPE